MQDESAVAAHYNSLDPWYLKLWGEHVHHGLWKKGNETPEEAVEKLVELVVEKGKISSKDTVCDIGCGYGGTARMLSRRWGAKVTGFSLSERQIDYAKSKGEDVTYFLSDWLKNPLPPESFDVAISIESSEHMVDKAKFFQEAYRVLRPGGRLVVCAWLSKEQPKSWEKRYFLEPICREGRLPSMGSPNDYHQLLQGAHFENIGYQDLSSQVKKTWAICGWRMIKALRTRELRDFLFKGNSSDRFFAKTLFRILAAYQTKSMIYGVFWATKA